MYRVGDRASCAKTGTEVVVTGVKGHSITGRAFMGKTHSGPEHLYHRVRPSTKVRTYDKHHSLSLLKEKALRECLASMKWDWNGHKCRGTKHDPSYYTSEKHYLQTLFMLFHPCLPESGVDSVLAAHKAGKALDTFVPIVKIRSMCPYCEHADLFETNGLVLRPVHACTAPDGMVSDFTLNVPSGKVIITDDLRALCRIFDEDDINTHPGVHRTILHYATNGLALGYGIGNSCPTVFCQGDGKYAIGRGLAGQEVASISTNLWAYSIMDYEDALKRAAHYKVRLPKTLSVVEIPAGSYLFRHFHGVDHGVAEVMFATFERVGPAEEPVDWVAKDCAAQMHFTQDVALSAIRWPTLYGDNETFDFRCASVCLSVFRSASWHQNGFPIRHPMGDVEKTPTQDIPHFLFQYSWWLKNTQIPATLQDVGSGCVFNESYAIVVGRILESLISYGVPMEYDVSSEAALEEMRLAVDLWYKLVEKYPHVAQESAVFAGWMEDRQAVDLWVSTFNLPEKVRDPAVCETVRKVLAKRRSAVTVETTTPEVGPVGE